MLAQMERVEAMRDQMLAKLDALPPAMHTARPASGGWSALEVIEHLVLSEESVMAGIDEPEGLRPRRRSLRSRIGYAAVLGVLASPIPVKVPTPDMEPGRTRTLEELRATWHESHRVLRRHIQAVQAGEVSGAVFSHPVSGPLTTEQAIQMLAVHMKRHGKQLRRILEAVEREGASSTS